MGETSWQVKARYNKKVYDNIAFTVKKGEKDELKKIAESKGLSLAGYIKHCIEFERKHNK